MTTIFLNLPPHLLPSPTPHILNSAALWYFQWTKYFLTSSPPQLLTSSTPPLSGTPSGQNTSSPPPFLNSAALWYPQWTKYLLTYSTLPLSGAPSGPTMLSGGPSGPNLLFGTPKWCSLAPQVALSNAPSGAFWRLSWQPPPLLSSAL